MSANGRLRIGILAGEASGDILGGRVLVALRRDYPQLEVEGIGGPLMAEQGLDSMFPMDRLSVMGFTEPLKRLPELLRIRASVVRHFLDNPPDFFLGIDSPDFNLTIERKLRERGIPTAHLVSPSVWAWRRGRIKGIRRAVDRMLCLFPFETQIYRDNGIPVDFVGHPLAEEIPERVDSAAAREALGLQPRGKLVALLPGSRGGEVKLLAPIFLQAALLLWQQDPDLEFVLPAANPPRAGELREQLKAFPGLPVTLVDGRSREVMAAADVILLASGTATLEAALLKRPMVVAYRLSAFTWFLVSRLVHTEFAALPNVLAGKRLVPELLQEQVSADSLARELTTLLESPAACAGQVAGFDAIHATLRRDFAASVAAALGQLANNEGADGPV